MSRGVATELSHLFMCQLLEREMGLKQNGKEISEEEKVEGERVLRSHLQQLISAAAFVVELHSTRRWWIIDTNINLYAAPLQPASPNYDGQYA